MPLLAYEEGFCSVNLHRNWDRALDEYDNSRTRKVPELGKVKLKLTILPSPEFYLLEYEAV
jgi:hypothetical protein